MKLVFFFPLNVWFTSPAIFLVLAFSLWIRLLVTPLISLNLISKNLVVFVFLGIVSSSCWTYRHKVLDKCLLDDSDAVSLISVTYNACYFLSFLSVWLEVYPFFFFNLL